MLYTSNNNIMNCFRCKTLQDITLYTGHTTKVYKICKPCRDKHKYKLNRKKKETFTPIENNLSRLNYIVCKLPIITIQTYILRFNYDLINFLNELIKKRYVLYDFIHYEYFIPISNNSLVLYVCKEPSNNIIKNKEEYDKAANDVCFLKEIEKDDTCDICYTDKQCFLNCQRCNHDVCTECYKKSNLYNCMFCRYSLEDHLIHNNVKKSSYVIVDTSSDAILLDRIRHPFAHHWKAFGNTS